MSPWEGFAPEVALVDGIKRRRCIASFWLGRTRCNANTASDFFVGQTRTPDDTEEYPDFWPGIRVVALQPGTTADLTWRGMRLAGHVLSLRRSVVGRWRARWKVGDIWLEEELWTDEAQATTALPSGSPRRGKLTLRLTAETPNSVLTLDGHLVPSD